ncbi:MAG: zinc-binding dehydrogenase, partial [Firmicutes bacterium]|nr:zinc-binding dehydrogenase [Bacillota bacterium]
MQAIVLNRFGASDVLRLQEISTPMPGPDDILIHLYAAGVNRADIMEREGRYPPPAPRPRYQIPGLEGAGIVVQCGESVTRFHVGDRVMALLSAGGYATETVCPESMAMPLPDSLTFEQGAAIPEVFLTAYDAIFWQAGLHPGQTVLIHAGAGGVGSAAIQLAHRAGMKVITTVGSDRKQEQTRKLGADFSINYHDTSFVTAVRDWTNGQGVAGIIDFVGQDYLADNLLALQNGG